VKGAELAESAASAARTLKDELGAYSFSVCGLKLLVYEALSY
jgi:hypothetical protein